MKIFFKIQKRISGALLILFILTACDPGTQIQLPDSVRTPILATLTLSPSATGSLTPTLASTPAQTATPLPLPTSTPRSHEVKLGETLLGIALQYNVALESIRSINPNIDAYSMKVGDIVLIPAETLAPSNKTPVPTAITLPVSDLNCLADTQQGVWCLGWVQNNTGMMMESVMVTVNLADQQATNVYSKNTALPLNVLQADARLPFAVYFEPPMPLPFQSSVQFSSSIPLDNDINQYRQVNLEDLDFNLTSPQVAKISGMYQLPENTSQVWIIAAALDQSGKLIGLRRWQSSDPSSAAFEFSVYAVSGEIADVQAFAEAQP
jgi:LysM repeat protein